MSFCQLEHSQNKYEFHLSFSAQASLLSLVLLNGITVHWLFQARNIGINCEYSLIFTSYTQLCNKTCQFYLIVSFVFDPYSPILLTSLVAQTIKHLPTMRETQGSSLGKKILWRRKWHPTPVLLPAKSHGGRSTVGYSPQGRKESDTTERLHFLSFFLQFFSLTTSDLFPRLLQ